DGIRGRVLDITWLNTVLAETADYDSHAYTGRIIHVPNNRLLTSAVRLENLTGVYNAHHFKVTLPKGTSQDEVLHYRDLLAAAVNLHCEKFYERATNHMKAIRRTQAMDTPKVTPHLSLTFEKDGEVAIQVRIVV